MDDGSEEQLLHHLHFCLRRMSGVSEYLAQLVGPGSPLPDGLQGDVDALAEWASGAKSDVGRLLRDHAGMVPIRPQPPVPVNYGVYRKVLRMVGELHLRGYQRLRIAPGMSASGMHWRCSVTPASNVLASHGARLKDWEGAAHYTSGMEARYFDWADAARCSPGRLAELFLARFPEIAAAGHGPDWPYAGWYVEMLSETYPDLFPVAYADWDVAGDRMETTGGRAGILLSLPPPGEASGE